jgi:hypothetical protein
MTKDTILTALIDWAGSRGIQIVASEQPRPPAFLDMRPLLNAEEADSAEAGLLVTIDSVVHSGESAQLGFWIPTSLKKGTWCSVGDSGDDEIASDWIPDFGEEKELMGFVARTVDKFFLQYVFEPALDEYLADKGISYVVVEKKEFCGEAAEEAFNGDLMDWLFVEFQHAGGYDITLGVSGWGDAATFYANEEGFLTFDQRGKGLRTREVLVAWLESVLGTKS